MRVYAWNGPSRIDYRTLTGLWLTDASKNPKTGAAVVQGWIMAVDGHPWDRRQRGDDHAVCGSCPIKSNCYVGRRAWQAPSSVWKASRRHQEQPCWDSAVGMVAGKVLRLGAYGDPSALPADVVGELADAAEVCLSYTHRWRDAPHLQDVCMASVETDLEAFEAWSLGWRTFRAAPSARPLPRLEVACPSLRGIKCEDCRLCQGTSIQARSICIPTH